MKVTNHNHTTPGVQIFEPSSPEHFEVVRRLFKEYMDVLFDLPGTRMHTELFPEAELADLETGKYTPPSGTILLALYQGEFTGVVALRKLTDDICEMKRLFVRPSGRGTGIGLMLAQQIIQKGREMGYRKMRLDTHPAFTKAQQLYYSLGFYDIPRYNQNIVPGILFMELDMEAG